MHIAPLLASGLLWTAPEILREYEEKCPWETSGGEGGEYSGSQKGDIYSFAIILQELLLRAPPFGSFSENPQGMLHRYVAGAGVSKGFVKRRW